MMLRLIIPGFERTTVQNGGILLFPSRLSITATDMPWIFSKRGTTNLDDGLVLFFGLYAVQR